MRLADLKKGIKVKLVIPDDEAVVKRLARYDGHILTVKSFTNNAYISPSTNIPLSGIVYFDEDSCVWAPPEFLHITTSMLLSATTPSPSTSKKGCTCTMTTLMVSGCKCGGK